MSASAVWECVHSGRFSIATSSSGAMIGGIARNGVGHRSLVGSFPNFRQCSANVAQFTSLRLSSSRRGGLALTLSSEFSWFRPIRPSLNFPSLSSYEFRASSFSNTESLGPPDLESEIEEKAGKREWKVLENFVKALGVAILVCTFFLLKTKIVARSPRLLLSSLKTERIIDGEVDGHEVCSKSPPHRPALDSPYGSVRKSFSSSILQNWRQQAGINERGKYMYRAALGGTTSVMPTYVNTAVDQDLLEIDEEAFEQWLVEVKDTAVKKGLRESVVVQALQGLRPSKRIMELDSNQPEVKLTLEAYLKNMINVYRVNKGVSGFQENELLLTEISSKYGVPSPILVAIWGIESSYGAYTGNWDVIRALGTLAYASKEPRRAQFFKGELFQALRIIQDGHGPQSLDKLRGSWAGAMGQCQFMPTSFQAYAVDYDGDGRKDIWESRADIFASMANYLMKHGWKRGGLLAQKVKIEGNIDKKLIGLQVQKSVLEWTNMYKVRVDEGQPELPPHEMASLVAPDGPQGSAYLVFSNFRTIMRYNTSSLYAIAVWQLALQIIDGLGSSMAQFPELVSTLKC
ncbi:membrane-bound lytic murein transglycosylase B [Marchantia polymorpha subsp. ruderalis]|uniref:Transglycosylase SLT domain-containing protein n=2 Tax=Marchantia polymorpha TaxID=3197 RepID=A0A176WTP7_MARPO|nr:hypothetical protein AXG93_879s1130 [Marchantia polymorpha subsp. ruderalis]PTQ42418.1 hypothetical protein MARPO_0030s0136 [Marchantia polymorpha]BBN20298.1 hypothetical protein Mp_8g18030 [Marchantia polymorpha subsp. ruderalis]|eukprot:PTQ42418.1 hypothetical protein MARPO_0030s0136 [Marchantia polymorpha]